MARESSIETRGVAGAITSMSIDELIFNMAKGIADGQARLDRACMELAVQMGDAQIEFGKIPGTDEPDLISLIELGFTPNFYQFVDTILEVRVSMTSQFEEEKDFTISKVDQQDNERKYQHQYASDRQDKHSGSGYGRSTVISGGRYKRWTGNFSLSGESSSSRSGIHRGRSKTVKVNTVDASLSSKYSYEVAASSMIKTKIVPIPPPQVLEEAVQNAAKERKEWAKRFALLHYSKGVFSAISDSITSVINLIGQFLDDDSELSSSSSYNMATDIKDGLENLNDEYIKLTTDHWSVIESVKDRRLLDNYFEELIKSVTQLMDNYAGEKLKEDADTDEINATLTKAKGTLGDIKTKIGEIIDRLPLTPEEQAAADQQDDKQADQPQTTT